MSRRRLVFVTVAAFLAGAAVAAPIAIELSQQLPPPAPANAPPAADPKTGASAVHTPTASRAEPSRIDVLIVGGGPLPESNQVSIEHDVELASGLFDAATTRILFGGGNASPSVQVLDAERRGDEVEQILADFFDARGARDAHYAMPTLASNGPATLPAALESIERAVTAPVSSTLDLIFIGHGDHGEQPRQSAFLTWSGASLDVPLLVRTLGRGPRPVRVIATSCFSGGFSNLVFHDGDERKGPNTLEACGLFASTWDREASGCDPDPDRASQNGFSLTFFSALGKRKRDGSPLPSDEIDFDHDRSVSFAEALAYAAIESESIDVPTRTSERWLEVTAPTSGPSEPIALPEIDALIERLSARLECDSPDTARAQLDQIAESRTRIEAELEPLELQEQTAYERASAALLSRFPTVNDPWHPDYVPTLEAHGEAILAFFDESPEYAAWVSLHERVDNLSTQLDDLRVREAPYLRVLNAHAYRNRASRLRARGGHAWERFERLRACECAAPTPR